MRTSASDDLWKERGRDWHLRAARLDDFEALAMLFAALHCYNASFDEKFALAPGWKELLHEHFLQTQESESACWLLAWQGTEPVGLLVLESHTDSPLFQYRTWVELVALYVMPTCRKTGLAHRLMEQAYAWTAAHGGDRMQLYVTTHNEQARAFYHRRGWRPVQEIWRLDVEPLFQETLPLADPSRRTKDPTGGCRSDLLSSGHHQIAMGGDLPNES